MEKSQPVQSPVAADLRRVLNGYLGGQLTIEGAWEAERSLDATADVQSSSLRRIRPLRRVLNGYLGGQLTIEGFLAWEAERSLDATADTLRVVLDRLSIVAAEVCDGVRDEGEFRALAREVLTGTLEAVRVAVAETPAPYRVSESPE